MRPTWASRLGLGGGFEGGGPGGGRLWAAGATVGAGVLFGDTTSSTGESDLIGEDDGERSVTGVRSDCDGAAEGWNES